MMQFEANSLSKPPDASSVPELLKASAATYTVTGLVTDGEKLPTETPFAGQLTESVWPFRV